MQGRWVESAGKGWGGLIEARLQGHFVESRKYVYQGGRQSMLLSNHFGKYVGLIYFNLPPLWQIKLVKKRLGSYISFFIKS